VFIHKIAGLLTLLTARDHAGPVNSQECSSPSAPSLVVPSLPRFLLDPWS
jgi:hypothetical protein